MTSNNRSERLTIGLILCIALVTFFSPFVSLRLPVGDQSGGIFDARGSLTLLQSSLHIFTTLRIADNPDASAHTATAAFTIPKAIEVPYSLRIASSSSWFIYAALECAALALLALLSIRKWVAPISLIGGFFGAGALFHLLVMSSDLRTWSAQLMQNGSLGTPDDPVFPTRVFMLSAFHVNPGPGLYLLTACLFLVPLLTYTRAVPKVASIVRREARVSVSQPVRVRPLNPNYAEETCLSVNLSPSGLYLESASDHYYPGMEVYVTRDPRPGHPANHEEHGSVIRVDKLDGGKCRFSIRIFPET